MGTRRIRPVLLGCAAMGALATLVATGHPVSAAGTPGVAAAQRAAVAHSLDPLNLFQSFSGDISSSIDGIGDSSPTGGPIQVHKNVAGATLRAAYLFAATTGGANSVHTPTDGDVTVNGTGVTWITADTGANDIGGSNAAADITSIIKSTIDAAPAGDTAITVSENAFTAAYDGEEIVAILDDPSVTTPGSVTIMYGANNPAGDTFNIGLAQPFNPTTQELDLSLGIGYGFQSATFETGQWSTLKVNGTLVSSALGGQDDCIEGKQSGNFATCGNGELFTVGGIGDSLNTPTDPTANDVPCPGGAAGPRCDDELYGLNPFVASGANSLSANVVNPTANDNIMTGVLTAKGTGAVVGEGVALGPTSATNTVGAPHTLTARAQTASGSAVPDGTAVTFTCQTGPNSGLVGHGTTTAGAATFTYTSKATGTDVWVASFTDNSGAAPVTFTSNQARKTWVKVAATPLPVPDTGAGGPDGGSPLMPGAILIGGALLLAMAAGATRRGRRRGERIVP